MKQFHRRIEVHNHHLMAGRFSATVEQWTFNELCVTPWSDRNGADGSLLPLYSA